MPKDIKDEVSGIIPVNIEQDEDDPNLDRVLEHTAAIEEKTGMTSTVDADNPVQAEAMRQAADRSANPDAAVILFKQTTSVSNKRSHDIARQKSIVSKRDL